MDNITTNITVSTIDGAIVYYPRSGTTIRFDQQEAQNILGVLPGTDRHCELVHINITDRCNKSCEYCYVDRHNQDMALSDFKEIVDKCVKAKVFQITLGGGEPFLHPQIHEMVRYAAERINVCTTSNGSFVNPAWLFSQRMTLTKFRQINVSYHENFSELETALEFLQKLQVRRGINFVYNKNSKRNIPRIVALAKQYEAELLLLQYKPIRAQDWDDYVAPEETFKVAQYIAKNSGIGVAIDGACALKCMMKKCFMTVGIDGMVYPCSFVHKPAMGNIFFEDVATIWAHRGDPVKCPYLKEEDKAKLVQ